MGHRNSEFSFLHLIVYRWAEGKKPVEDRHSTTGLKSDPVGSNRGRVFLRAGAGRQIQHCNERHARITANPTHKNTKIKTFHPQYKTRFCVLLYYFPTSAPWCTSHETLTMSEPAAAREICIKVRSFNTDLRNTK